MVGQYGFVQLPVQLDRGVQLLNLLCVEIAHPYGLDVVCVLLLLNEIWRSQKKREDGGGGERRCNGLFARKTVAVSKD